MKGGSAGEVLTAQRQASSDISKTVRAGYALYVRRTQR